VNGSVPLAVHENLRAQSNVIHRRDFYIKLVLIILLVASNLAWLIYDKQYETYTVEQEVDTGDGDATVIGVGDYNGENKTESNGASQEDE
jgi:hypothetical protein